MIGDTTHSILRRIVGPANGDLAQAVAKGFLRLTLADEDQDRIQYLAERNTEDALTAEEKREYEGYVFIGEFLALMQAKARLSLQNHPSAV